MRSSAATFRKHSSAGVDWASWFLGIGLGLTLALQVTTMRQSDISSVYAVVATVSRLAALTGTYFAIVGIFLVARIPWVERGAHILDPHSGLIAIGAKSATVIGPDGGLADAMATALMVAGDDGSQWFGRQELLEYSAWVIERNDGGAWGVGPLITAR